MTGGLEMTVIRSLQYGIYIIKKTQDPAHIVPLVLDKRYFEMRVLNSGKSHHILLFQYLAVSESLD